MMGVDCCSKPVVMMMFCLTCDGDMISNKKSEASGAWCLRLRKGSEKNNYTVFLTCDDDNLNEM